LQVTYKIADAFSFNLPLIYSGLNFVKSLIFALATITIWLVTYGMAGALTLGNCFSFFVFVLFGLIQVWVNLRTDIKNYNSLQVRDLKTQERASLVSQLLPAHVKEYFPLPH